MSDEALGLIIVADDDDVLKLHVLLLCFWVSLRRPAFDESDEKDDYTDSPLNFSESININFSKESTPDFWLRKLNESVDFTDSNLLQHMLTASLSLGLSNEGVVCLNRQ